MNLRLLPKQQSGREHYKGNILLVGINYDKEVSNTDEAYKRHSCVIEKA